MGVRKNYRNLTDVERDRFVQALNHVKSTGLVDQFAEIHERHFSHLIHRSSHFLPWHREMLLRFERALQLFHPDITIPYWDSTVDRSPSDPLWSNNFLGQFDSAWNLRRALGSGPLSTQQEVETNQRRDNYDAFWRELENPIHNRPHVWVGGVMNSFPSPGDPVFYLHHCWIDMLWARWQLAHPGAPFVSSGHAGAGLNDPLMEWPDRTPADVLDHHALGYSYEVPRPPAPPAVGKPMGGQYAGTGRVVYRGFDGHVHEIWLADDGWYHHNHTASLGAPLAAGDPMGGQYAGTGRVVYRGQDSHVHEIWLAADGWHHHDHTPW